jgi:hypothetical protein
MRAYRTQDPLDALRGALRSFDLLGQLPIRELSISAHEPLHDFAAIADDWDAVGEDLREAIRQVLTDRTVLEGLSALRDHEALEQLNKLRTSWNELARSARKQYEEIESQHMALAEAARTLYEEIETQQMPLFEPEIEKKVG